MNIYAIIPAAGTGSRAGFEKNKILKKMGGVSVIRRTAAAFAANPNIDGICICVSAADEAEIARELAGQSGILFARGGGTRTESVKNALERLAALPCPPDYVLIHDAARPFVSQKIIDVCVKCVQEHGSAVCAMPCTDTAVLAENCTISAVLDREKLFTLQTPQGFDFAQILSAYRKIAPGDAFTDDSGVYARYVAPPRLFAGEASNKKLTFAEDFAMNETRTGIGVDTHAFCAGDHIVLGGVHIPHGQALRAHSDGDVLCHAVMDALLSAAGLADIGHYFPDTDPQYKGANSLVLLSRVCDLLEKEGFGVGNVSAAIVAERPKLAPYIAKMKQNLADVLQISEHAVGISAGTNEGLGYLGRGEGIAVIANALLRSV